MCKQCSPGMYQAGPGATACIACPAGTAQASMGGSSCDACVAGQYQPDKGGIECVACDPGTYQGDAGATVCKPCARGTWNGVSGVDSVFGCINCLAGTYAPSRGSSACALCARGTFANFSGSLQCTPCFAGTFSDRDGTTACDECAVGSFSTSIGGLSGECQPCGPGTYGLSPGGYSSVSCVACNRGTFSTGVGRVGAGSCSVCKVGTYSLPRSESCGSCPLGTYCPEGCGAPVVCDRIGLECDGSSARPLPGFLLVFDSPDCLGVIPCPAGSACVEPGSEESGILNVVGDDEPHFVMVSRGSLYAELSCGRNFTYGIEERRGPGDADGVLFRLTGMSCDPGFVLSDHACVACPSGSYSTGFGVWGLASCRPCQAGTFAATAGSTHCDSCRPGSFQRLSGAEACGSCAIGYYQDRAGQTVCQACRPGTFQSAVGGSSCKDCPGGTSQPALASSGCLACNASFEYSSGGDTFCFPCGQVSTPVGDCQAVELPREVPGLWISVEGVGSDGCAASGTAMGGSSDGMIDAWAVRLDTGAVCNHSLRVFGHNGVSTGVLIPAPRNELNGTVELFLYNRTFYPDLCRLHGLGFLFKSSLGGGVRYELLDPSSRRLLFQGVCESEVSHGPGECRIDRFCPTMDVLVRLSLPGGSEASGLLRSGQGLQCPPTTDLVGSIELQGPYGPRFTGETVVFHVQVLNLVATIRLLAFRLVLRVGSGFSFVSFQTNLAADQDYQADTRVLTVKGDATGVADGSLGRLAVRLDASQTGIMPAVSVMSDGFAFMTEKASGWLPVSVQTMDVGCHRRGVAEILTDYARCTSLIVAASRGWLVNWARVQAGATRFKERLHVLGVWNTGGPARVVAAECRSLTPGILRVSSCTDITARKRGMGLVLVSYGLVRQQISFSVVEPEEVHVRVSAIDRGVRIQVLGSLFGQLLDVTPFVLPRKEDEMVCPVGFRGNLSIGKPILHRLDCARALVGNGETADKLFLLGGEWTDVGDFRLRRSQLSPSHPWGSVLLFRQNEMVLPKGSMRSSDPTRLAVEEGGVTMHLVRQGSSPRCVSVTDGYGWWSVAVSPPSPVSLHVELSTTVLVVRQDHLKLVPSRAEIQSAALLLSDGTFVDVVDRLRWSVSEGLRVTQSGVEALYEAGTYNVTAELPGAPCVTTNVSIVVHSRSVASAALECSGCPRVLTLESDPMSLKWPDVFPGAVPVDRFVVRRYLVDGGTSMGVEPLKVNQVVRGDLVVASRPGSLKVSSSFAQGVIVIPVVRRWVTRHRLLCNDRPCHPGMKLSVPGDKAAAAPFSYVSRLKLGLELTLCNGTILHSYASLPDVLLHVNGKQARFPTIDLVPGRMDLQVTFGDAWLLSNASSEVVVWVHALESLRLAVPAVLYQLHCSRIWERAEIQLEAVLTDGVRAVVLGDIAADGVILRLDPTRTYVKADWPGRGWINASFGGLHVSAKVEAVLHSRIYTNLSLDGIPERWLATAGDSISMGAKLLPLVAARDGLLHRVVRWGVFPEGVVKVTDGGGLTLLSDSFEKVVVSGTILSCQGMSSVTVKRSFWVKMQADRAWQVDFGENAAPPLEPVQVGRVATIPIYLLCLQPLLEFTAFVSLPGMDLACTAGALPLSECVVSNGFATFQGNFTENRQTGRVLLGSIHGVLLVNGLSRLRVSLAGSLNTTYEFTLLLGVGPVQSVLTRQNAVTPGSSVPSLESWSHVLPESVSACCDVLAASEGSAIAHLTPSKFRFQNISLMPGNIAISLTDPRIQVFFEEGMLSFDAEADAWTVKRLAWLTEDTTRIVLRYTHPLSLEVRETSITVTLAEMDSLILEPPVVHLRRIHCHPTMFETKTITAWLRLQDDTRLRLQGIDISNVSVDRLAKVSPLQNSLEVTGSSTGNTSLVLRAFGLMGSVSVMVADESSLVRSLAVPDPYLLEAAPGAGTSLNMTVVFDDGRFMANAGFLVDSVVLEGPFARWDAGRLLALRNTHPKDTPSLSATVGACGDRAAMVFTAKLSVRLMVRKTLAQPADVMLIPAGAGAIVTLYADTVSSFLLTLFLDGAPEFSCEPGPDLPPLADCSTGPGGRILLAGVFPEPRQGPVDLALVSPMPESVSGGIEFFSGLTGCVRLRIVAGLLGEPSGVALPATLPAVDPGTLARLYSSALARPWDKQAMLDTRYTLQLLTDRQRLVDTRLYSNEFELSAMFGVTDRFFVPDTSRTSIDVLFHTTKLPPHPDGRLVAEGLSVRAKHFLDGWYVVQWIEAVPQMRLDVSLVVSTSTSVNAWEHVVRPPLVTGRPLHECPRVATDRASFLAVFRIHAPLPGDCAVANIACAVHAPTRRIRVDGTGNETGVVTLSVAMESFARIHQAYLALESRLVQHSRRRLLNVSSLVERVHGILYINDSADPPVACPPGMYFSENGTYVRLPLHARAGLDCYGMSCLDGFLNTGTDCVPVELPVALVWVCVMVVSGVIFVVSCVLCALHLGNKLPSVQECEASVPPSSQVSDIFTETEEVDDTSFQNIVIGSYLDDYSKHILDDYPYFYDDRADRCLDAKT